MPTATSPLPLSAVIRVLGLVILFGGNQVASKVALHQFGPWLSGVLAFSLAALALGGYARWHRLPLQPPSALLWRLHAGSAGLFFLFNAAALLGLQWTLASRASVFIAFHPFFVVLFSRLNRHAEPLGRSKVYGLSLTLIGLLLVFGDRLGLPQGLSWWGDSLLVLASALLGWLILHLRRVTATVSALQATFWQITLSLPWFLLAWGWLDPSPRLLSLSSAWLGILYVGLGVNALAFVVRAGLFQRYSVSTLSAFLTLSPIVGLALGHLLLGDVLSWGLLMGTGIVSAGIVMVYRASG